MTDRNTFLWINIWIHLLYMPFGQILEIPQKSIKIHSFCKFTPLCYYPDRSVSQKRCGPLQAKLTVIWKYSNEYNVRNLNDEPANILKQFKWIWWLIR